ncbi:MAG: hypothetical protein MUF27_01930 [Acidobacteria bacterium]|jgi:hypothetical protein|nr:hypothetical protein [Acidobacteriota bacterium]
MADPRVQGIVEFILKEKGLLDASARLKKLESEVNTTRAAMVGLGKAGEFVGATLRTYLAPLAVFGFLTKATQDWIEFEKRMRAVGEAMRKFGIDTDEALPRLQAFFQQIALGTGIVDDETLPAFQKFLNLTGDLEAAMGAVSLAVAVSRSQVIEMSEAADLVADLFGNRWSQAARKLGLDVQALGETAADQAKVIDLLSGRLEEYLAEQEKAGNGVTFLKSQWDGLGDQAGQLGEGIWKLSAYLIGGLVWALERVVAVTNVVGVAFWNLGRALLGKDITDSAKTISDIWSGAADSVEDVTKNVEAFKQAMAARGLTDEMEGIGKKLGEVLKRAEKDAEAAAAAQKKAAEELERTGDRAAASLGRAAKAAEKVRADRLAGEKAVHDLIVGYADEVTQKVLERWKVERDAQAAALESEAELLNQSLEMQTEGAWYISDEKVAIVKETLDKIAEAEIQALEEQRDREISAAEALGADTAAIRTKWNNAIEARSRSHQAAMTDLEKMSTKERAEFWLQYAQVVAGALSGIFGQNKALAIAEAVINTALAVLQTYKTYGMTPWGHAAAALMIAAGLVQIQKIKSANPGSAGKGFDDPVNDRMAYHGGRRWAQDYIEMTSRGFADGLRIGPVPKRLAAATQSITNNNSSSVTHDQSTGQVIHVHGAFIDSDSLRTLGRKLKQVERSDAARFQR